MILAETPPLHAHHILLKIYDYMQKEKCFPVINTVKEAIRASEKEFNSAIQWLISRSLLYESSNVTNPQRTFCPAVPRYKYLMDLLTLLDIEFLFKYPLFETIWERDSPIC